MKMDTEAGAQCPESFAKLFDVHECIMHVIYLEHLDKSFSLRTAFFALQ